MGPLSPKAEQAFHIIEGYTGSIVARSIVSVAVEQAGIDTERATPTELALLIEKIDSGLRAFLSEGSKVETALAEVRNALGAAASSVSVLPPQTPAIPSFSSAQATVVQQTAEGKRIDINEEYDIVSARGECRDMCAQIGFTALDQVKIATVVSELARNIVQYAGKGYIVLTAVSGAKSGIEIVAVDHGKGIPHIGVVMSGSYESETGMGVGLIGTKRLMDDFELNTGASGTRIIARKYL